jgi:hypothetical protein
LQVIEPQVERLRDAQTRCSNQPEECCVHLALKEICPSQSTGGLEDSRYLLGRVDVRERTGFLDRKYGDGWYLVGCRA